MQLQKINLKTVRSISRRFCVCFPLVEKFKHSVCGCAAATTSNKNYKNQCRCCKKQSKLHMVLSPTLMAPLFRIFRRLRLVFSKLHGVHAKRNFSFEIYYLFSLFHDDSGRRQWPNCGFTILVLVKGFPKSSKLRMST